MKLVKSLLLGSAAALTAVATAQAADLPTRKAAPVEYVRICDAYGAGFFYIPGTDTCLRVGGLVLAEIRAYNPSYRVNAPSGSAAATPSTANYQNQRSRDAYGYAALGRIELDARTATAYGTLRTFVRADSYFGSSSTAATGSLVGISSNVYNATANTTTVPRETTIVNKAFIQFAGLTAGRAQSFFDFYADAYNYEGLRGSNATVALLAYTATFGGGFSATLSLEDQASRRGNISQTITGQSAVPAGTRVPDVVGNLRVDQPWGAVQLSAAAHQLNTTTFASAATATPPTAYAFPTNSQNAYGFAIQGGVQINLDALAPGDKLWLQAAYEKGASSYIDGSNMSFSGGPVNGNRFYGVGIGGGLNYGLGWNPANQTDCVWTGATIATASCEQSSGYAFVAALKHYWLPTLSSGFYGSYMAVNYSANANNGIGGTVGFSNLKEVRVGTNLVWTPVKGFDIGAEFMYEHLNAARPVGLSSDAALVATGLPAYRANNNEYEGRLRVQRAF